MLTPFEVARVFMVLGFALIVAETFIALYLGHWMVRYYRAWREAVEIAETLKAVNAELRTKLAEKEQA